MLANGYAAVTYRSVAAKAAVTAGLVQYYFPTLDDLFIALLRRRAERNLERLLTALAERSDEPLRVIWEFSRDETTAAPMLEFMALANHRKSIRTEIAEVSSRVRQAQLEALVAKWPSYEFAKNGVTPAALLFLLTGMPKTMLLEEAIGVSAGHGEFVELVHRCLDATEPAAPAPRDAGNRDLGGDRCTQLVLSFILLPDRAHSEGQKRSDRAGFAPGCLAVTTLQTGRPSGCSLPPWPRRRARWPVVRRDRRRAADPGGIRIWAGIVSESETDPAQKPIWNDSRPVRETPSITSDDRTHHPFESSSTTMPSASSAVPNFLALHPSGTLGRRAAMGRRTRRRLAAPRR